MTNNVRIKFKGGAKFQIRNAPDVKRFLEAMGTTLRDEANSTLPENEGYRMSSSRGINYPYGHWRVNVYTSSNHAKNSNAQHNTLLRLLQAR
jgi:hypothetical protein